jgi:hypothetical protein
MELEARTQSSGEHMSIPKKDDCLTAVGRLLLAAPHTHREHIHFNSGSVVDRQDGSVSDLSSLASLGSNKSAPHSAVWAGRAGGDGGDGRVGLDCRVSGCSAIAVGESHF